MDGALGSGSSQGTHGADHEVGEELVLIAAVGHVLSKVGDLVALGLGALEGAGVAAGGAVGAHGRGAQGAHSRDGRAGSRAQAQAGSGGEGRHCEVRYRVSFVAAEERGGCCCAWRRLRSFPPVVVRFRQLVMRCRKFWSGEWLPQAANRLQKLGNWSALIRRPTATRTHPQPAPPPTRTTLRCSSQHPGFCSGSRAPLLAPSCS